MSDFKKRYLKTCIIGLCIAAVLAAVFFLTGNNGKNTLVSVELSETSQSSEEPNKILFSETRGIVQEKRAAETPAPTVLPTPTPYQDMGFTENIKIEASPAATLTPTPLQTDVPKKTMCYISINCRTLIENPEKLKAEKKDLVPANGMLILNEYIAFSEGDSLFDVLQKTAKEYKIPVDFEKNAAGGGYVKGIGNLYEKDAGDMSGWGYTVNGEYPNVSCTDYKVKNDDKIEWIYMQ